MLFNRYKATNQENCKPLRQKPYIYELIDLGTRRPAGYCSSHLGRSRSRRGGGHGAAACRRGDGPALCPGLMVVWPHSLQLPGPLRQPGGIVQTGASLIQTDVSGTNAHRWPLRGTNEYNGEARWSDLDAMGFFTKAEGKICVRVNSSNQHTILPFARYIEVFFPGAW